MACDAMYSYRIVSGTFTRRLEFAGQTRARFDHENAIRLASHLLGKHARRIRPDLFITHDLEHNFFRHRNVKLPQGPYGKNKQSDATLDVQHTGPVKVPCAACKGELGESPHGVDRIRMRQPQNLSALPRPRQIKLQQQLRTKSARLNALHLRNVCGLCFEQICKAHNRRFITTRCLNFDHLPQERDQVFLFGLHAGKNWIHRRI